jgi:hypothetical protein
MRRLGPESCFAAAALDGLAGTTQTTGSAGTVVAEVAGILSSQGQNFCHLPDCSALPFDKGRTPMLSATPWITDSTIVQNIVIIADSIIYNIADPDTLVFKSYKNSLATWTSLNTRVYHKITQQKVNCNEPPSSTSATGRYVGMQTRDPYQLLILRITCMFEYAAPKGSVQQRTGK